MKARFFKTGSEFRAWLEKNHAKASELLLGFYTTKSGKGGITHKHALDEALCFGWIDGRGTNIDPVSYSVRFSPRSTRSHWSRINIKRMGELTALGLVAPAGKAAFDRRDEKQTINYSYELNTATLEPALEAKFKANKKAWEFFNAQPPSYQRVAKFYVTSAKKPETRAARLEVLLSDSAHGLRLGITRADKEQRRNLKRR